MITAILICLIILPIYFSLGERYHFYLDNICVIFIAVTFMRYIFLMKHHWLTASKWIKAVFIFIPIPILFFLLGARYDFQAFYDEKGLESMMDHLSIKKQNQMSLYIRTEMLLFWVAAFVSNIFMPFRMIISIFREMHRGSH